jgi:hypothetical protein
MTDQRTHAKRRGLPLDWEGQRRMIHSTACHYARLWAHHQDQSTLIEDLENEGWCVVCQIGAQHPRIRWEIPNAMMDYLAKWLYGVGRNKSKARGSVTLLPLTTSMIDPEMDPLSWALCRERVMARLTPVPHACACGVRITVRATRCGPCAARRRYAEHRTPHLRRGSPSIRHELHDPRP